jgi:hypothetical protein
MRNSFILFMSFFLIADLGHAQNANALIDKQTSKIPANSCISTDLIAKYINSSFKTENEKIRAVFYWTASNISYDIDNMFAINFNETSENKIKKSIETRKGVCINYAEIFNEIANKVGLKSVIIEGYTRQNGFSDYVPHAWCGANIDGKWYVFDPTWGSGYVSNGKFIKKINNYYFKTEPGKIITSHIPFDYLWQFSNYPITNQEFYNGKTLINKSKKYFDYENEILKYEKLTEIDKLIGSAERIEKNGVKNAMIFDRLSYKKREIENKRFEDFNHIVTLYNEGVNEFNAFIDYRNKQFKPIVSDDEIKKMIDAPKNKLINCQDLLNNLGPVDKSNLSNVNAVRKGLVDIIRQAEEQEMFVVKYLSKSRIARKSMFTKVSWFGIPLN